jgi:hypothetical protein
VSKLAEEDLRLLEPELELKMDVQKPRSVHRRSLRQDPSFWQPAQSLQLLAAVPLA